MSLDFLTNLFANVISAFAGVMLGIGSMWFSKASKKEFVKFDEIINGRIDKLERETEDLRDKIYQKLIELSSDIAVIKDRDK